MINLFNLSNIYYHFIDLTESFWPNSGIFSMIISECCLIISIFTLIFVTVSSSQSSFSLLQKSTKFCLYSTFYMLLISLWVLYNTNGVNSSFIFGDSFTVSITTQIIKISILIISIFFISFPTKILKNIINFPEFYLLFILINFFAFILVSCSNFVLLILTLEGFSLTLYILTTIERSYGSITAAVKYFTFGTLGSLLLFWGVVQLYTIVPSLSYNILLPLFETAQSSIFEFSAVLILAGFLLKLGAAPFHQWVVDVYTGTHIFITAIFATSIKFILFILFIKIAYYFSSTILIDFTIISSLIVGCYFTLIQVEVKRFLAYSSIVHVGFMLMGDINSSIVYLLTYIIANLLFFSVLLTTQLNNGKELIYFNDLYNIRNFGYFSMFLSILALSSSAGLPPFAGFYGKYLVWISLIEDIYIFNNQLSYIVLILSIFLSLLTIFYYMRLMIYFFINSDTEKFSNIAITTSFSVKLFQTTLGFIILFWTYLQGSLLVNLQVFKIF